MYLTPMHFIELLVKQQFISLKKKIHVFVGLGGCLVIILILGRNFSVFNHRLSPRNVTVTEGVEPSRLTSSGLISRNTILLYPEESYFIPRSQVVNPHNFEFIIRNDAVCKNSPPYLLVIIPSVYHHTSVRKAIRATWASVTRNVTWPDGTRLPHIALIFMFGTIPTVKSNLILKNEQDIHGDIVQETFVDTYFNLTIKIIGALRWVTEVCPGVKYILKTDEDVFVNIPQLISVLRTSPTSILGRVESKSPVLRYGRWSVLRTVYPYDFYPPYVQGNTYVIPGDLAPVMYNVSMYLPYLPIEDVFITGILRKTINASLLDIPGFTFSIGSTPTSCDFPHPTLISKTNVKESEFYTIWNNLHFNTSCH